MIENKQRLTEIASTYKIKKTAEIDRPRKIRIVNACMEDDQIFYKH